MVRGDPPNLIQREAEISTDSGRVAGRALHAAHGTRRTGVPNRQQHGQGADPARRSAS